MSFESANISAENTFTNPVGQPYGNKDGAFTISGTWVGTVSVQRSLDYGVTWDDIATFTGNTTATDYTNIITSTGALYRIGIATGNYTSGTAVVSIRL